MSTNGDAWNASVDEGRSVIRNPNEAGAYEIKFLVDRQLGEAIITEARRMMQPDPYSATDRIDGYQVNSVYFDTAQWDVFQRNNIHGKQKFRLRRYGKMPSVFAECKHKQNGRVNKQRTELSPADFSQLFDFSRGVEGKAAWYVYDLRQHGLKPKVQVIYERAARVLNTDLGPIRLTLDQSLRCRTQDTIHFPEEFHGDSLLPDHCILEMKFQMAMPDFFKDILHRYRIASQPISKYRMAVEHLGLYVSKSVETLSEAGNQFPGQTSLAPHSQVNLFNT